MLIHKCDVCKKVIPRKAERFSVTAEGDRYDLYLFCKKCGKPIAEFLRKKGLVKKPIKVLPF